MNAPQRMPEYRYPAPREDANAKDIAQLTFAGEPVLRNAALPVRQEDIMSDAIQQLLGKMVRTMRAAPGVGLAAPQIGVNLRIAVIEDQAEYIDRGENTDERERTPLPVLVLINPEVKRLSKSKKLIFHEGCLSVPGYLAEVQRDYEVIVSGLDGYGQPFVWQPKGWPARIVQHEVDHLRGILYVDKMNSRTLCCA
jgi:peptide deformylase